MTFLIISIFVYTSIALVTPKRISKSEMYHTSLFSIVFVLVVDFVLSMKFRLYGYFSEDLDLRTLLVIFGIFPAANIIYLNLFPFRKGMWTKIWYIIVWSIIATLYEWLSIKYGYFYHNAWKIWYSLLAYPLIFIILKWDLVTLRRLGAKAKE